MTVHFQHPEFTLISNHLHGVSTIDPHVRPALRIEWRKQGDLLPPHSDLYPNGCCVITPLCCRYSFLVSADQDTLLLEIIKGIREQGVEFIRGFCISKGFAGFNDPDLYTNDRVPRLIAQAQAQDSIMDDLESLLNML